MAQQPHGLGTALIHGSGAPQSRYIYGDPHTGAVNTPIYQTSTYEQPELGQNTGWEYSRTGNPTRAALEALMADLEEGDAGFAFASGMAAITAVLMLLQSGDEVLISSNVYGGTFRVLSKVFAQFGLRYRLAESSDVAAFAAAITPATKLVLLESPANPLLTLTDIAAVAALCQSKGVLLAVDNTFMTPYLQRPLTLGADIVIHSATKYLGGHSDLIAGLVVVSTPALAERLHFIQNATGGVLQPFDSFLLLRSIKTLGVRMDRHVQNAQGIAQTLQEHTSVAKVHYPGVGAMIAFELAEGLDLRAFLRNLRLIALAESLGGVESLICHPASMTHASIPAEIRAKVGITEGLLRLSVGLEDETDLRADLLQALQTARMPQEARM